MKIWTADPSSELVAVFSDIAQTRMHDVPICNPALCVEAVGFQRTPHGHWAGVMITPWAINLLCLPSEADAWPALLACAKYDWHFASGDYEFTVADEERLGNYHLCSLFSPAFEFPTQEQARLTALAVAHALHAEPMAVPEQVPAAAAPSRRAFLGLGR
ncbi:[NiFe]-hydrogenase assembly chaperone HybE [Dechloromonas sp. XY25]|uniref:[NiFe]-hydrogenase assembly chaperone HybE n=1 Tax=Dechloromonas hankyongensis TaxID=2908002 RepID=A0ABS9JXG9_9RHOO|nr:[NiFe]-hydrogenase assembly chaperone HybE [Dechloromonas hankyongensis]MCG2575587.1 [NiFe]-hydrogenase assembly chaperone HybE [Dechloromonas hankyongensis]